MKIRASAPLMVGVILMMAGSAMGQVVSPPPAQPRTPEQSVRKLAPRPKIVPQVVDAVATQVPVNPPVAAQAQPAESTKPAEQPKATEPAATAPAQPAPKLPPNIVIPDAVRDSAPIKLKPGLNDLQTPSEQPAQVPTEKKPVTKLKDIPYEPLAQKDADGHLIPLSEPVHLAALRRNPMVQPGLFDTIGAILRERKASFEQIVISNLDLLEKIKYDDVYGKTNISNRKDVQSLLTVTKPLSPPAAPKFLGSQLKELGLITAEQDAYSMRILRDYAIATVDATMTVPEGDSPEAKEARTRRSETIVKTLYRQNVDEATFTHNALLGEAAAKISELLPQIGLDADNLAKANAIVAAANGNGDQMLSELRSVTTLDQRRELLRKTIAARPK
jgi:hypothetical protein